MSDQNDASKRLHDTGRDDDDSLFGKEAERDLSSSPVQVFDSFGDKDDRDAFSAQAAPNAGASSQGQPGSASPYTAANPYQQVYGQPGAAGSAGTQPYAGAGQPGAGGAYAGAQPYADNVPPYQPYSGGQSSGGSTYTGDASFYGQPYPGDGGYASAPPSSGKATAALVCGILAILFAGSVLLSVILGVVAIVLAGSYVREGGTAGTAKAGRVCGIVGIVFSALLLIFYIAFGVVAFQAYMNDYNDLDFGFNSGSSITHEAPLGSYNAYDDQEQAAISVANEQLDSLAAGDHAMLEAIGAMANEGFTDSLDVTMEECGIDPVEYARIMTSGLTYQVSYVVVDEESGGFVSYDVSCRDIFDVLDEFSDSLTDLQYSGAANTMADDQLKARIGELFMQAVNDADFEDDFYVSLDMAYENGAWVIDQATWDSEMDYLFGLS